MCQNSLNAPWHRSYKSIGGLRHHSSTRNSIIWCFVDLHLTFASFSRHIYPEPLTVLSAYIRYRCAHVEVEENAVSGATPEWWLRWPWHTSLSWSSNHSVTTRALWALSSYGGIAMVTKTMTCPVFFYMTLSINFLINSGTTPVWSTVGWWHLNWGGLARGNGWIRMSGMVANTSNTWFPWFPCVCRHSIHSVPPIIMSRPPLSSLHWCGSTCFQYTLHPSFTQVYPLFW